jgi:CheY-like chemotaxis protein
MTHTILVVDDQELVREAMADLLRRHHYVVELAANGKEALDRLCEDAPLPELVLLDLEMPVMDGWEFLYYIAQDRSLRRVPVIVISGSAVMRDAIVVPASVTFVAKPVQPVEIMKVIAAMLEHEALAGTPTAGDAEAVAMASDRVDTERHVVGHGGPAPVLDGDDVYWSSSMSP